MIEQTLRKMPMSSITVGDAWTGYVIDSCHHRQGVRW